MQKGVRNGRRIQRSHLGVCQAGLPTPNVRVPEGQAASGEFARGKGSQRPVLVGEIANREDAAVGRVGGPHAPEKEHDHQHKAKDKRPIDVIG